MGIFTNAYILPVVHFYVREIYDCILIDNSLGRKKNQVFYRYLPNIFDLEALYKLVSQI